MEPEQAMGLFVVLAVVLSLLFNVLFYRVVFRAHKRKQANFYSWLTTLAVMLGVCLLIAYLFVRFFINYSSSLTTSGGAFVVFIVPLSWFVPSTVYTIIRAIFIAITKREKDKLSTEIIAAEVAK